MVRVRTHKRRTNSGLTTVRHHERKLDFPKGKSNNMHLIVLVPSTRFDQKISNSHFERRILETKRFLSIFGGYTKVKAIGGFIASNNRIIEENIAKVETYASRKDYLKYDLKLKQWIRKKKIEWKQESIGLILNNRMFFI